MPEGPIILRPTRSGSNALAMERVERRLGAILAAAIAGSSQADGCQRGRYARTAQGAARRAHRSPKSIYLRAVKALGLTFPSNLLAATRSSTEKARLHKGSAARCHRTGGMGAGAGPSSTGLRSSPHATEKNVVVRCYRPRSRREVAPTRRLHQSGSGGPATVAGVARVTAPGEPARHLL